MTRTARIRACIVCSRPSVPGQSRCRAHLTNPGASNWAKYVAANPERAAFYKSTEWLTARAHHLRQFPTCVICGRPAQVVDHIVSRAEGGSDLDRRNLQSMCRRCHSTKTQNESHRGRKRAAQRRKGDEMNDGIEDGTELAHRVAERWLDETDVVPIALIAVEIGETVDQVAGHFGDAVRLDDVGMRAVPVEAVREFIAARAEQTRRMQVQSRRIQEKLARASRPVPAGVPALEHGSPMEAIQAAPGYQSVSAEFGRGSVRQELFDAELAESQRRRAEELAARKAVKEAKRVLEDG